MDEAYDTEAYEITAHEPCSFEIITGAVCDFFREVKRFQLNVITSCRTILSR